MKIAIPVAQNQLCTHFGHCENFMFFDVDLDTKSILKKDILTSPPHEPGLLPRLLSEKGVTLVIAGGMGGRAQQLFLQKGIKVITGANPADGSPEDIVKTYLSGALQTGTNPCDH